jgi:hypothetical protein
MPDPTVQPLAARYLDSARREHHVITKRARDGRWRVLDVLVVETLTGHDDGQGAAQALARDYAAQQHHPHCLAA